MKKLYDKDCECCGCEACFNACPVKAIEMKENNHGELFPEINSDKCIQCGKCLKVCPLKKDSGGAKSLSAYGAISKDSSMYKNATSGGIFAVIADYIISQEGMVVGSALENEDRIFVKHICIDTKMQIVNLQGSKYVQSRIGNTFMKVKEALSNNRVVLFSGTPCQVAGLKSYLGKEYSNLYTVDIVCHGVPSLSLLQNHISYLEKRNNYRVEKIEFRKKGAIHSGIDLRISYQKRGKKDYMDIWPLYDSYYQLFLDGHTYRDSCYSCKFANDLRQGDFTICDFWGAKTELHPDEMKLKNIVPENGLSGILVNTPKGELLFKKIEDQITSCAVKPQQIIKWNAQLKSPSRKKDVWFEVREQYLKGQSEFEKWYLKKYRSEIIRYKMKKVMLVIVPIGIRSKIKKILRRT